MYFSKKVYAVYNGVWGKSAEDGGIFCGKSNLPVSYRKKLGEQDVLVAPPIILLGEQLLSLLPVPVPMHSQLSTNQNQAYRQNYRLWGG